MHSKFLKLSVLFFFQAEDGIRDLYVTGVQTCALPIYGGVAGKHMLIGHQHNAGLVVGALLNAVELLYCRRHFRIAAQTRSEERRVGKEWRTATMRRR